MFEMLAGRSPFDVVGGAENPDQNTEDYLFQGLSNSGLFRLVFTRDVSARDYGKEERALRTVTPASLVTREVTGDKFGFALLCWLCHVGILVLCGGLGVKLMRFPTC